MQSDVITVTTEVTDKSIEQNSDSEITSKGCVQTKSNRSKLITDATVAPQNITYPTDLKLLNAARQKSEELIDKLYSPLLHDETKVRTYRQIARKDFLNTAKRKAKSIKVIYKANGSQLRYLKRNLGHIEFLLKAYPVLPVNAKRTKIFNGIAHCLSTARANASYPQ